MMKHTLINGITGVGAVTTGSIVNNIQTIEPWLRFTSLLLGCVIGSVTLYNLIKRGFKND